MFWKSKSKLKVTGRAGLVYKRDGKTMRIYSEMLMGDEYDMVIYQRSMTHWESPHAEEPITENEKQQIKDDVKQHLKRCKIDWQ